MAFSVDNFKQISGGSIGVAPRLFSYYENATLATISASAYMNDLLTGDYPIALNDIVIMVGSDAAAIYYVTSVTTNVEVTLLTQT